MAITMEISQKDIESLCKVGRGKAHDIWLELLIFCDKGDDYIPSYNDFAKFRKKPLWEVLFCAHATKQDVKEIFERYLIAKNEGKVIEYISPLFGKVVIPIPDDEEIVVKTVLNKLEVTPHGQLDAAEKEITIKKVKKK